METQQSLPLLVGALKSQKARSGIHLGHLGGYFSAGESFLPVTGENCFLNVFIYFLIMCVCVLRDMQWVQVFTEARGIRFPEAGVNHLKWVLGIELRSSGTCS